MFTDHPQIPAVTFVRYDDVIMTTLASQITSLTVVYSIVYSDQRKHQSSASLAFVRGIHRASNAENVSIWWRHLVRAILQELSKPSITKISLSTFYLKSPKDQWINAWIQIMIINIFVGYTLVIQALTPTVVYIAMRVDLLCASSW